MRRGYVQWRVNDLQQKHHERQRKAARPKPPLPPPFEPTFAEAMASASQADQLVLEKQIFSELHRPQQHKIRGQGYRAQHHQLLLAKQRRELINNYLALYHTAQHFITTPEQLEAGVLRAFQDTGRGFEPFYPQSYGEILRDVEEGSAVGIFDGYTAKKYEDMENDLYNAMMGTVAQGGPGYDEVTKEITDALAMQETPEDSEAVSTENIDAPAGESSEALAAEPSETVAEEGSEVIAEEGDVSSRLRERDKGQVDPAKRRGLLATLEAEEKQKRTVLERMGPPPDPEEPIVMADDLEILNWQRKEYVFDQQAISTNGTEELPWEVVPIEVLDHARPFPGHLATPPPEVEELETLSDELFAPKFDDTVVESVQGVPVEAPAIFEETDPISKTGAATLDDESPLLHASNAKPSNEEIGKVPTEFERFVWPSETTAEQEAEVPLQEILEQTLTDDQNMAIQDLSTAELDALEKLASGTTSEFPTTVVVDANEISNFEDEQAELHRLREKYQHL